MPTRVFWLAAIFALPGSVLAALPFAYEMEIIDAPDGLYTLPTAINDSGVVVGWNNEGSFRYDHGTYLSIPKVVDTNFWRVYDINNNGVMAIVYTPVNIGGSASAIGTPEDGYTLIPEFRAIAINDSNQVVGVISEIRGPGEDFRFALYENGTLTVLGNGTPGDINNAGQFTVVHEIFGSNSSYCSVSVYSDGALVPLGIDGDYCNAESINSAGDMSFAVIPFQVGIKEIYLGNTQGATLLSGFGDVYTFINDVGHIASSRGFPDREIIVWEDGDTVSIVPLIQNPDPVFTAPGLVNDFNNSGQVLTAFDDADPDDSVYRGAILTPVNLPPVLQPVAAQTVNEMETLTIALSASDPENGQLSYYGLNLSAIDDDDTLARIGATLDIATGVFSWTPAYDQAGNYEIEFTVIDDGAPARLDMQTVVLTVGNINRPPLFDTIAPVNAVVGEELMVQFSVSDPDADLVSVSSNNLPAGATIIQSEQALYWTPEASQTGVTTIDLLATDNGEPPLTTLSTLTVTVGNLFTPAELIDLLATTIQELELPRNVEKDLLKAVQKVDKHFNKGKVDKAINEARKLISAVQNAVNNGDLDEDQGAGLISNTEQFIALLGGTV